MKTTWAVASREFASKKNVLWAGLASALLAILAPLVPGASRVDPAEVRTLVVLFLGTSLAVGSAALVGVTMFGTDLAEKRAAWYYSRPIPSSALWWGKVAGGFAVVLIASAIAWLPAFVGGRFASVTAAFSRPTEATVLLAIGPVTLFGLLVLGNALSVALRSHSAWLVLDAAGIAVSGVVLWATARLLLRAGAGMAWAVVCVAMLGLFVVALALAGWRQVAIGRIDPKASHRALSTCFWSIFAAAAGACAAWSLWATSYSPADILQRWVSVPSAGSWLVVEGPIRGRGESFHGAALVDSASGRFVRLSYYSQLSVSRDGKRAAWAEPDGMNWDGQTTLMTLDLESPSARPVESKIAFPRRKDLTSVTLSPDGSAVAVLLAQNLAVHDVTTGTLRASVRLPEDAGGQPRVFFESPSVLKLYPPYASGGPRLAGIWRLDVASKRLERTGEVEYPAGNKPTSLRLSPAGDRFLVLSPVDGLLLLDGGSGRRLAVLAPPSEEVRSLQSAFLSDGRVAVGTVDRGQASLRIVSRDGQPERVLAVGPATTVRVHAEASAGRVTVVLGTGPAADQSDRFGRVVSVDVAAGTTAEMGRDLSAATSMLPYFVLSDSLSMVPGSLGTLLFRSRDGNLHQLDPATGRLAPFSLGGR
jgi:hypothetical protein